MVKIKDLRKDAKKIALILMQKKENSLFKNNHEKILEETLLNCAFNWQTTGKSSRVWSSIEAYRDYDFFYKVFKIKKINESDI